MSQRRLTGKQRPPTSVGTPQGRKSSLLVRCSKDKSKAVEYLMKIVDGVAIIGAKRVITLNRSLFGDVESRAS